MSGISYNLVRLTESYAHCLRSEGKSPRTIEWYSDNLKRFANFLSDNHLPESVTDISKEEARRFISHLQTEVTEYTLQYSLLMREETIIYFIYMPES